ncbi:hypothetical protein P170DRAFT_365630 [Aspergillus steynii IBT 23096]|uniref:GPI transamidase component PIG-S n=1 Tax=Aspergillus steynii IBT 23096 TaxID=1392250 RepID=A0A2I2FXU5_9EURO|nr:uncharacterized protein P170DRAFT_365630 [Aspergillus steynii IBT 23096]PLB45459.1 hypothetical protein P170DRAFT_365630 [Aspergillus steynii IBT 23096]
MAKTTGFEFTARAPSTLLLLALVATSITPTCALNALLERADSCPKTYSRCENAGLPDSFCCPSSSTCVALDGGTSAICCPKGQSCSYIQPITCDVQLQNATLHETNAIKTTRLDDSLPKCGDSCCPFGYKCKGNEMCEMDDDTSSSTTTKPSSTHTTTSAPSEKTTATKSDPSSTTDHAVPTVVSPTNPKVSASLSSDGNSTAAALAAKCPSYPSKAVLAGFFPGAIFGAVLAALGMVFFRRWQHRQLPVSEKVAQHTQRSSNGTLIGISSPIPTEDTSYRTDFLLRRSRSSKRNSEGARSVLQRTGTRVRSLFGSTPKITVQPPSENVPQVPAIPPMPAAPPLPVTPPRQTRPPRQPSTESIRVYTPPGVFANTGVLKPDPYPSFRPDTTFTDMIDRVGFKDNKGDPSYRVNETPQGSPDKIRIPRRS